MNFTYQLKKTPDNQYGAVRPDGTWNGMIRELQMQNADIGKYVDCNQNKNQFQSIILAVAGFAITKERSEVTTLAYPLTEFYMSLFIKNPEGSLNLKSYVAPLTYNAWIAIAMFVIIGSFTLYMTTQ